MKEGKYPQLKDGEAIRVNVVKEDIHFSCCDCGLVHIFQFHHVKDDVWDFAIFRHYKRKKLQIYKN